jgi:biotin transport system substrate-specific component
VPLRSIWIFNMRTATASPFERLGDHALLVPIAQVVGFALLTAICAQVRVYMPGNPVPMTLQTFAVGLAGVCLPIRRGVAAMALYLLMGVVGLPVFADLSAGPHVLFGATGGYLVGFVLAAPAGAVVGPPTARATFARAFAAVLVMHAVVFVVGVPWLALAAGLGLEEAVVKGCLVFLPGTVLKSVLAALVARR